MRHQGQARERPAFVAAYDATMALPPEAYGNKTGWITAGVIAVVMLVLAWTLAGSGSVTPATAIGKDASRWSAVAVPAEVKAVVPASTSGGTTYDDLLRAYRDDPSARRTAEATAEGPAGRSEVEPELERVLDLFIDTTNSGGTTFFADSPGVVINYDRTIEPLDDLHTLGRAAVRQASVFATQAARDQDFEGPDARRARDIYEAVLALGSRLAEERVIYRQWRFGTQLMADGLSGLSTLSRAAGDADAGSYKAAGDALSAYLNETTLVLWEAIGSANNDVASDNRAETHFGDVLAIARSDEADPLWRTEAILRLGKARFGATRTPDRNAAERTVASLAESLEGGPLKLAAEAARDLDAGGFRVAR